MRRVGMTVLAGVCGLACARDPEIIERPIVIHSPRACQISQSQAYAFVYGAGDFEPSVDTPPTGSAFLREVGLPMTGLPASTRALVVDISQGAVDWRGVAEVPPSGPVNILVWPSRETCSLTRNVELRTGSTVGVFGRHVLIAGGKTDGGARVARTYVGDLSTGILEPLELGLRSPRIAPTITAFRKTADEDPAPAIVAGGENADNGTALNTAEVYEPVKGNLGDLGDFDRVNGTILLSNPRKNHSAVLLASGDTALIGGEDETGKVLTSIDVIDVKRRVARSENLAALSRPRKKPTVLRLASGEIFVAGGLDRLDAPVPVLEWLSADVTSASSRRPYPSFVMGRERGFVALEAGGALAVIAPPRDHMGPFNSVWVISADGTPEAAVPIDAADLEQVTLFAGGSAPVLFTGKQWLRWQPWFGAFERIADAPVPVPSRVLGPICAEIDPFKPTAPRDCPPIVNGDPGLALWLETVREPQAGTPTGTSVTGWRFASRTRFDTPRKPLLVDGPSGLAPDRLAGTPGSSIRFVEGRGLVMGPGASAFVTDVTFADVLVELDVVDAPPSIVLREETGRELEVGGVDCAFTANAKQHITVLRKGTQVTVRADEGETRTCQAPVTDGARVQIGIRGGSGVSTSGATNLRITRR